MSVNISDDDDDANFFFVFFLAGGRRGEMGEGRGGRKGTGQDDTGD